jgi:hypothetical protein
MSSEGDTMPDMTKSSDGTAPVPGTIAAAGETSGGEPALVQGGAGHDDREIVRPNGKVYRRRKPGLWAHAWQNETGHDAARGVIVFGTHDPDRARAFAEAASGHWHESFAVVRPRPGWFRDAYDAYGRAWVDDPDRGAPGVMFWTDEES